MNTFLLIFILFNPAQNTSRLGIAYLDTMQKCEEARAELLKKITPEPGIYFVLSCVKTKPTDGIGV